VPEKAFKENDAREGVRRNDADSQALYDKPSTEHMLLGALRTALMFGRLFIVFPTPAVTGVDRGSP
jgi:hypothetical protein